MVTACRQPAALKPACVPVGQMHQVVVMDKEKEHMSRLKDAVEMKVSRTATPSSAHHEPASQHQQSWFCSSENSGGTDGEPQRGSSQTAEPPPR